VLWRCWPALCRRWWDAAACWAGGWRTVSGRCRWFFTSIPLAFWGLHLAGRGLA
jgi:hypothetical protein